MYLWPQGGDKGTVTSGLLEVPHRGAFPGGLASCLDSSLGMLAIGSGHFLFFSGTLSLRSFTKVWERLCSLWASLLCVDLILSLMTENVVGDGFGDAVGSGFNFPTVHRKAEVLPSSCGFFFQWACDTPTPEASQRQGAF